MSMMKKVTIGLFACAIAALPLMATAEEASSEQATLSASADLPILSAYVWRGQVYNDEPVLQPTFTISKGGLSLNWWGNFNLTDNVTPDSDEFSEHDISISYSFACPLTGADATLGVVNYDFPNSGDAPDTRELFLSYALSSVLLSPTLSVYYDFKEADGFYGSLSISHSLAVSDALSLDLGASLGAADSDWSDYYYGAGTGSGLNDWSVSASLPFAVCDSLTITPGVQYVALLGDAKDAVDADSSLYFGDTDKVVGSLTASYTF